MQSYFATYGRDNKTEPLKKQGCKNQQGGRRPITTEKKSTAKKEKEKKNQAAAQHPSTRKAIASAVARLFVMVSLVLVVLAVMSTE